MDWGNVIVCSKTTDVSGVITAIELRLHLEGNFHKMKKKVTWLAQPATELVDVTLLDHSYLITKKKLEESDDVKDFVTPVSEFREDALADANVRTLNKGDIIQFKRKGYYIFDRVVDGRHEFINIPDSWATSIASKAGAVIPATKGTKKADVDAPSKAPSAVKPPVETKMYKVAKVYGEEEVTLVVKTKMYKVQSVYNA